MTLSRAEVAELRGDFPALGQEVHGRPLVYLDNAASAQTPRAVLQAMETFYHRNRANIHRGVHKLSARATDDYEGAREKLRAHLNAKSTKEIIFTRGTTEAINLVASTYGRANVGEGDEIIVSAMEHHSNIVPWQMLCEETGATLKVIPMDHRGQLDLDAYRELLSGRTKLVGVVHVSNALGTINPVRQIIELAHAKGVPVLLDGAQAAPHTVVDVQQLDCDFYTISGHKLFGPTGIGVLYGRQELLEAMPPYQGGGDMILTVSFSGTTFNELPYKFEAGTPAIAEVIGLGAAVDYINGVGLERVAAYEAELLELATARLEKEGVRLIGTADHKAAVCSFTMDPVHPHDIGTILDREGVAIRTGHHCAQPVMEFFEIPATSRASFAFYNTPEEVDALGDALSKVREVFKL